MKYRRVKILEEMFRDIAQPAEIKKLDELYATDEKGLAIVYMLRKIKPHWDNLKDKQTPQDNEIKINYWNINKHELS